MRKPAEKLILALETGIDGGSVAILRAGKSLCVAEGTGNISRSEDLLFIIDELLSKNGLCKEEIGYIAVSDSPGSLTGIRIGLATAAGLGISMNAKVFRISTLEAMLLKTKALERAIAALYSEKTGIFYCRYQIIGGVWQAESEIEHEREATVFAALLLEETSKVVLDKKLEAKFSALSHLNLSEILKKARIVEGTLAESLGNALLIKSASDNKGTLS